MKLPASDEIGTKECDGVARDGWKDILHEGTDKEHTVGDQWAVGGDEIDEKVNQGYGTIAK